MTAVLDETDEQRKRRLKREYVKRWQEANPEKMAAYKANRSEKRKENWDEFLAYERARYHAAPERRLSAQQEYRAANAEKIRAYHRTRHAQAPHEAVARCAKRRASLRNATPAWADLSAIEAFYAEARRLTNETGMPWEVDHIYPLTNKRFCGLHVPANLQVIRRDENRRKFNRAPAAE